MKFKNYRNRFNRTNRIYSDDDIRNMKLAAIFDNENDILAQNNEIGIPTLKELQDSQNTRWIKSFVDSNGKQDGGYWQSIPEEEYEENYDIQNEQDSMAINNDIQDILLKGGIDYNNTVPTSYVEKLASKYDGLSQQNMSQKTAAKNMPYWSSSEKEYYEHGLKLADGEEPTEFMKENNDFRKINEIDDPNLKQIYIEKAASMYGLDVTDKTTYDAVKNTPVVIPKENSQLYSQIKNSETFQKWIADNYENIKNQTNTKTSIEFPKSRKNNNAQRSLFATIHNANLLNSKINEDGSFSVLLSDGYDFAPINDKQKGIFNKQLQKINNNAYVQQELGQLQNYLLSSQINLTKEELEEILRKFGKKH